MQALLRSGEIETSFWDVDIEDGQEELQRLNERAAVTYGHMEEAGMEMRRRLYQLGRELSQARSA